MKIPVNGREIEIRSGSSLLDLMVEYELKTGTIIVALNESVVQRDFWAETPIEEGDHIELISVVGGG
jgi:sulfur carrier protein